MKNEVFVYSPKNQSRHTVKISTRDNSKTSEYVNHKINNMLIKNQEFQQSTKMINYKYVYIFMCSSLHHNNNIPYHPIICHLQDLPAVAVPTPALYKRVDVTTVEWLAVFSSCNSNVNRNGVKHRECICQTLLAVVYHLLLIYIFHYNTNIRFSPFHLLLTPNVGYHSV